MDSATISGERRGLWRSRWAAIGAAVAVTFGAGGIVAVNAAPGPTESTIVTVTPERIMDTRDPNNIGLTGPFISAGAQKLQVTGSIPTATGTKVVVPTGATGVLLNVTPVSPTAAGFISIRPGDATGAATTSSLNFTPGGILPNAVQVALPTTGAGAGKIDITYDAYGTTGPTTDILIDVVGYMTNTGLQQLVTDVAAKANTADVYTKLQTDAGFLPQGDLVQSQGVSFDPIGGSAATAPVNTYGSSLFGHDSAGQIAWAGPENVGGVQYGLKSVTYCLGPMPGTAYVGATLVVALAPAAGAISVNDGTDRFTTGCYTVEVNNSSADSYAFVVAAAGTSSSFYIYSLTTTWAPASTLPAPLVSDERPAELNELFGSPTGG